MQLSASALLRARLNCLPFDLCAFNKQGAIVQALQLLSVLAAIRLGEKSDKIENILSSTLNDAPVAKRGTASDTDPLASSSWEDVLFNTFKL